MNPAEISIVIIWATGYSGATWLNLVLGSHEKAMAMGPVARILDLERIIATEACFIHRDACLLWPNFLRKGNHAGRFFENLARHTGRHVFFVNYPPRELEEREISGKGFRIRHIKFVRDGRANLYSKIRHEAAQGVTSSLENILRWQIPKWEQVNRKAPDDPEKSMLVHYEDLLNQPGDTLRRLGSFVGLNYNEDAIRFWEFEHHLTAGNTAVIDTLCRMQDVDGWGHHRSDHYDSFISSLKQNADAKFKDEEWRRNLSREDLLAFDCLLGEKNSAYGYPRDTFSDAEKEVFWGKIRSLGSEGSKAVKVADYSERLGLIRRLIANCRK